MSGNRTCFMGRGSRRSQGQHMQLPQLSNPCTSVLLHGGAVPRGLPTTLKYNNKVSGSDTLQKSQGLVPDSISRSVGPCRQSQSDLDTPGPWPSYVNPVGIELACEHSGGGQRRGGMLHCH